MQGSGTEERPYLPTTISEFITACSGRNKYVKLTQDIDAYDDPTYVGELTTAVDISSNRLYADTPVVVKNVTVRSSHMIYFGLDDVVRQYVENIHFLNWVHKKINNGSTIYWTGYTSSGYNKYVNNCKFSVKIDNGPYYPLIFSRYINCAQYLYCKFCSFYFEYPENMGHVNSGYDPCVLTSTGLSLQYCNMIIKNLRLSGSSSNNSRFVLELWKLDKTSIIFDSLEMYSENGNNDCYRISNTQNLSNTKVSYSYIAFVNPIITYPSGPSVYYPYIYINGYADYPFQNCLFATSDTRIKKSGIDSVITCLTLEQLKDKSYLEGIGWLP